MPELSICMPSHRNLADSRQAIESAIAYCDARDAILIVSDNSGDAEKQAWLEGLSPRLVYIDSASTSATENMLTSLDAASTPFVLPMGDDDQILSVPGETAVDLASLPFDYVGVLPVSEPFSGRHGALGRKAFSLTEEESGERIAKYVAEARGNNSCYYSIYRRDVFVALTHLFLEHHPTKGSYCDWALSLALVSYGKMAHDPSTVFRYNMDNWDSAEKVADMYAGLFRNAGLPDGAEKYERLLMFLDLFVLATRAGSPLSQEQRQKVGKDVVNRMLGEFIRQVADAPESYDGTIRHLATMALEETNSFTQFQIGMMMADRVQPGLKDRYVHFVKQAMGVA